MNRIPMAEIPRGDVRVPGAVLALAGEAGVTPVWRNELGGLTFRIDRDHET